MYICILSPCHPVVFTTTYSMLLVHLAHRIIINSLSLFYRHQHNISNIYRNIKQSVTYQITIAIRNSFYLSHRHHVVTILSHHRQYGHRSWKLTNADTFDTVIVSSILHILCDPILTSSKQMSHGVLWSVISVMSIRQIRKYASTNPLSTFAGF
eukprot:102643_1